MKNYVCDYALASFSLIERVVTNAFPHATVMCYDNKDGDTFEAFVFEANDLDMLDDIMAEYLWED